MFLTTDFKALNAANLWACWHQEMQQSVSAPLGSWGPKERSLQSLNLHICSRIPNLYLFYNLVPILRKNIATMKYWNTFIRVKDKMSPKPET